MDGWKEGLERGRGREMGGGRDEKCIKREGGKEGKEIRKGDGFNEGMSGKKKFEREKKWMEM